MEVIAIFKKNLNKVFIIAEAGVNHNGDVNIAKKLIDVAADTGADAVKFQTFKAENLVIKQADKAEYQKKTTAAQETQFEMIKKLELDVGTHQELIEYCKKKNILFLSTPFDHDSIEMLNNLKLTIFKIPSGEVTNLPYLKHIGSLRKQIILSTGMAELQEIENAINILIGAGTAREKITVLHANTEYPSPMEDVNLKAMLTIANAFNVSIGYSDHTLGIEVSIAAVAMGATVIEKHFSLDRTMDGPDHQASLEPYELKSMVKAIRNIEKALGTGVKSPSKSELKNIAIARKSIVAKVSIKKNERLTAENLTTKRPGTGISPMLWDDVVGRKAIRDFMPDQLIEL